MILAEYIINLFNPILTPLKLITLILYQSIYLHSILSDYSILF